MCSVSFMNRISYSLINEMQMKNSLLSKVPQILVIYIYINFLFLLTLRYWVSEFSLEMLALIWFGFVCLFVSLFFFLMVVVGFRCYLFLFVCLFVLGGEGWFFLILETHYYIVHYYCRKYSLVLLSFLLV